MSVFGALIQVWTIARQSLLQALRMKVAIVLVVFLVVLVPALPFLLKSDSTHDGLLRLVITYSVHLISFLLGLLTLFLSSITLNTEIKNQHIFLLDPKPVSRGVVLLGKWLGVMLIDLVLLTVMMGITYGCIRYLARPRPRESAQQLMLVQTDVLTARRIVEPPPPEDLDARVTQQVNDYIRQGQLPEGWSIQWVTARVRDWVRETAWTVPPEGSQLWVIHGIPKFKGWLTLRFKHRANIPSPEIDLPGRFDLNESGQPHLWAADKWRVGVPHSVPVKSDVVRPDGTLEIRYSNVFKKPTDDQTPNVTAIFPYDGIQVLYPAASFGENFFRAGVIIFLRLSFIAIVGLFASTFLSFPVAVLLGMLVFLVGYMGDFIYSDLIGQMYVFGSSMTPPSAPRNQLDLIVRDVFGIIFQLFPNFGRYDVVPNLSDGMLISWKSLWDCFLWLPLVRGGVLVLAGWYIFRRRELAALTPGA